MKIYNMVKIDIDTGEVLEEDSFEYDGPIAKCDVGGAIKTGAGLAKDYAPAIQAGSNIWGLYSQANMMKDAAKAGTGAYGDYLSTINPPQEVLDARFAEAKSNIMNTASSTQRKLGDTLASRGVRGKGAASPYSEHSDAVRDALNQAYWNIYGNYNVPTGPGPSGYSPGMGDLAGVNFAQAMNYMNPLYSWWNKTKNPGGSNNDAYNSWMWQHSNVGR